MFRVLTVRRFALQRLAINAFIIFHLVAITCWCLPIKTSLAIGSKALLLPYFRWAGLFQAWDMFSPTPKRANSYVEAIVIYANGDTAQWAFPRVEHLSFAARYSKERYRKFVEVLNNDNSSALWPDTTRYIARLNNTRSSPVNMVLLVRYWSIIGRKDDGSYYSTPWDEHVFYSYKVQQGDLRRE